MGTALNVVIVLARCSTTKKPYGIRFEELVASVWSADWAFSIREEAAQREGYDGTDVRGTFGFAASYPGCPHCDAGSIFKCSCGRVACWTGEQRTMTCPSCGRTVALTMTVDQLSAEDDR